MKPGERGQGIAIDFLFAVLVFLLVLNACITLIGSSSESLADKSLLNELNAKTCQTIDMLVRTEGSPNDWEQHGINEARVIGLAKRDRALDSEKVATLTNPVNGWAKDYGSEDYNRVKSLLLIGYDYYFSVKDSSGGIVKINGTPIESGQPQPPDDRWDKMIAVNVKRIVNFNGEEAIAELTIYFPER